MGELSVRKPADQRESRAFTRAILDDIRALQRLVERGHVEAGVRRVGLEQEMYLLGPDCRPAPLAPELLERLADARFTTELARFNLEANFEPHPFEGDFLERFHSELDQAIAVASREAEALGARVLLTGILPTLRQEDLGLGNLTPELRYQHLNDAIIRARSAITLVIDGIERYEGSYDSVVLEGANTSLQLHLQVDPADSARLYNLMQLITAPLLAAATNSPVLLGRRLWHETRVAVFERALDQRTKSQIARDSPTRVSFGDAWVRDSVVEVFRDNVARFPVILTRDLEESSIERVERGEMPVLAALTLHNGTVWRWNRPCYGLTGGTPHLRIECRVLPAGPSILDEVANAALFYGMMSELPGEYGDVRTRLPFADARTNFLEAARRGLDAQLSWLDGRRVSARELLLDELIPAARAGLVRVGAPTQHIERYLGILEERVRTGRTGSTWLLETFAHNRDRDPHVVWCDAVHAMLEEQASGRPVHRWRLPELMAHPTEPAVGTIMTTDVFTVRPDDLIDLASSVMHWKHIRHIPVENDEGELVGVLTARDLLRVSDQTGVSPGGEPVAVKDLMSRDLVLASPGTGLTEAVRTLLESDCGCLLVVSQGRLLGIVTERDLLRATAALLAGRG